MARKSYLHVVITLGLVVAFQGCKDARSGGEGGASSAGKTSNGAGGEADREGRGGGDAGGESGNGAAGVVALPGAGSATEGEGGGANGGGGERSSSAGHAGSGDDDSGGQVLGKLADLLGPTVADQQPIVIGKAHIVEPNATKVREAKQLRVDADGTVIVGQSDEALFLPWEIGRVVHYDAELVEQSAIVLPEYDKIYTHAMALGPNGEVFYGGSSVDTLQGETATGGAFVGKLEANGDLAWAHQWKTSGSETTFHLAAQSDGAVIAGGSCTGQAPGNPAASKGGPWVARYEANGERTWLKQYAGQTQGTSAYRLEALLTSNVGESYLGLGYFDTKARGYLRLLDAAGALRTTNEVVGVRSFANPGGGMVFAPGEQYIYNAPGDIQNSDVALSKMDPSGAMLWFRNHGKQTATIDEVEGVIWNGAFRYIEHFVRHDDAIYLAGIYENSYENGSIERPTTSPHFVGRYDLNGNRVWFQELAYDLSPYSDEPADAGFNPAYTTIQIATDPNGNIVVVANADTARETSTPGVYFPRRSVYLFRLSQEDGSLIE